MDVVVRTVDPPEYDEFFDAMAPYHAELDIMDPHARDHPFEPEVYRQAVLEDMEGREFLWIEANGMRAGFAMVQTLPDWPDDSREIATITELYVAPAFRRHGVGTAAVQAILADHRERGTFEVEAGILRDNAAAIAFWARLGFELRFYQTARRP